MNKLAASGLVALLSAGCAAVPMHKEAMRKTQDHVQIKTHKTDGVQEARPQLYHVSNPLFDIISPDDEAYHIPESMDDEDLQYEVNIATARLMATGKDESLARSIAQKAHIRGCTYIPDRNVDDPDINLHEMVHKAYGIIAPELRNRLDAIPDRYGHLLKEEQDPSEFCAQASSMPYIRAHLLADEDFRDAYLKLESTARSLVEGNK